jgi:hypothetical protein
MLGHSLVRIQTYLQKKDHTNIFNSIEKTVSYRDLARHFQKVVCYILEIEETETVTIAKKSIDYWIMISEMQLRKLSRKTKLPEFKEVIERMKNYL